MKDNGKFMSMLAYVVLVIIAVVWAILLVVTILEAINVNVSKFRLVTIYFQYLNYIISSLGIGNMQKIRKNHGKLSLR